MNGIFQQPGASRAAAICMALIGALIVAGIAHAEDYYKSYEVSNRANVHVETSRGFAAKSTAVVRRFQSTREMDAFASSSLESPRGRWPGKPPLRPQKI